MTQNGYPCARLPEPVASRSEAWPEELAIVVIILVVLVTSHGTGVYLAFALAKQVHDLWCTAPGPARKPGGCGER